jgi:cytochrome b561
MVMAREVINGSAMQSNATAFIHFVFVLAFLGTLVAGVFLLKNANRLFGADTEMPSENSSSRSYGKMQVLVIWAHVAMLTGAFAFLLH